MNSNRQAMQRLILDERKVTCGNASTTSHTVNKKQVRTLTDNRWGELLQVVTLTGIRCVELLQVVVTGVVAVAGGNSDK